MSRMYTLVPKTHLLDKDFVCKFWIGCNTLFPALEEARLGLFVLA